MHCGVAQKDDRHGPASLATDCAEPDRDLVLDVNTGEKLSGAISGVDPDGTGRLVTIVPSSAFGETPSGPRRVVIVIDRSESMQGAAIERARKAAEACLGRSRRRKMSSVSSRSAAKRTSSRMLSCGRQEKSRGGGDILLMTDGQVFGTENILEQA